MHSEEKTEYIVKMPKIKDKERILKAAREKQLVTYREFTVTLSADFSKETLQATRDWQEICKVMKSRDLKPSLVCPTKLSFRIEQQIELPKQLLHEMINGLKIKKLMKTMNNKMTIYTYLSTIYFLIYF